MANFWFQNLLNSVYERAPVIEQVNVNGGRFIREGKVKFPTMSFTIKVTMLGIG